MDLARASALLTDKNSPKAYKAGQQMPVYGKKDGTMMQGYVFLCLTTKSCFRLLVWKTKKIWGESFLYKIGSRPDEYVYVVVSESEYNQWTVYETTGEFPDDVEDVVVDEDEEEEDVESKESEGPEESGAEETDWKNAVQEGIDSGLIRTPHTGSSAPLVRDKKPKKDKVIIDNTLHRARRALLKVLRWHLRERQRNEKLTSRTTQTHEEKEIKRKEREERERIRREAIQRRHDERARKITEKREAQEEARSLRTLHLSTTSIEKPPSDPNIATYDYPLGIKICGALRIRTPCLKHWVTLTTGDYLARKVNLPAYDGLWIMLRYPQKDGNTEYGLKINQWMQYVRNDGMSVSVNIYGLD